MLFAGGEELEAAAAISEEGEVAAAIAAGQKAIIDGAAAAQEEIRAAKAASEAADASKSAANAASEASDASTSAANGASKAADASDAGSGTTAAKGSTEAPACPLVRRRLWRRAGSCVPAQTTADPALSKPDQQLQNTAIDTSNLNPKAAADGTKVEYTQSFVTKHNGNAGRGGFKGNVNTVIVEPDKVVLGTPTAIPGTVDRFSVTSTNVVDIETFTKNKATGLFEPSTNPSIPAHQSVHVTYEGTKDASGVLIIDHFHA